MTIVSGAALSLTLSAPAGAKVTPEAMKPGGRPVELSGAAGDGPQLNPGLYNTKLPADSTARFARVKRDSQERMEIGVVASAVWKNNSWRAPMNKVDLRVELQTPTGDLCGSDTATLDGENDGVGLVDASVTVDPKDTKRSWFNRDECDAASELILSVQRKDEGDQHKELAAQVAVVRTPAVKDRPATPDPKSFKPVELTPLSAKSTLTPGDSFATAATMQAGNGYEVKLTPGRPMFFRVYVHEGQQLGATWQLPKNGVTFKPKQDLQARIRLYTPALHEVTGYSAGRPDATWSSTYDSDGNKVVSAYTDPVNYANAFLDTSIENSKTQYVTDPGWYYVVATVNPDSTKAELDLDALATTMSVRVTGTAKTSPVSIAQPETSGISGKSEAKTLSPVIWGGAAALGLAAVAGLGAVMYRRRSL